MNLIFVFIEINIVGGCLARLSERLVSQFFDFPPIISKPAIHPPHTPEKEDIIKIHKKQVWGGYD